MTPEQFLSVARKRGIDPAKLGIKLPLVINGNGVAKTEDVLSRILTVYQPMIEIKARVLKLSKVDLPVLILGETGTGKELIAEALHGNRPGKFVAVNCAGIPDTLLESEFFGCVKGAFTGAVADRDGYVTEAKDGTLFLDEIGDMPPLLQSKLLRLLQSKRFRRVGSVKEEDANFRVVSATNKDNLEDGKHFRPDLYYRLAGTTLKLPPLAQRGYPDMELIVKTVVADAVLANSILKGPLLSTSFPGNIRQLLNIIEEAKALNLS